MIKIFVNKDKKVNTDSRFRKCYFFLKDKSERCGTILARTNMTKITKHHYCFLHSGDGFLRELEERNALGSKY